jgi:hypothetical protein
MPGFKFLVAILVLLRLHLIPDVALELRDESSNGKKSTTYTRNA